MPVLHIHITKREELDMSIYSAVKPQKMVLRNTVVKLTDNAKNQLSHSNSHFYVDISWLGHSSMSNRNNHHHCTVFADTSKNDTITFCNWLFHVPRVDRQFSVKVYAADGTSDPMFLADHNAATAMIESIDLVFDYENSTRG